MHLFIFTKYFIKYASKKYCVFINMHLFYEKYMHLIFIKVITREMT